MQAKRSADVSYQLRAISFEEWLREAEVPRKDLARALDINESTLRAYLARRSTPSVDRAHAIVQYSLGHLGPRGEYVDWRSLVRLP